ncbi:MAG: polysaccharide biosynthesis/export family protein [Verrucomicrobiia bacterium]
MNSTRPINRCALVGWCIALATILGLSAGCSTVTDLVGRSNPPKSSARASSAPTTAATAAGVNDEEASGRLRTGDEIVIRIDAGAATATSVGTPSDVIIDDQGNIELPLVGQIKAAGLTTSELAEHIQSNYVPRYYVRCAASVLVAQRYFYVGGEVKNPGRFLWSEDTSLMKAINTASGFTDYANRGKVQLARGKERPQIFNCEELLRNPAKDVPIRPGDTVTVPRSVF